MTDTTAHYVYALGDAAALTQLDEAALHELTLHESTLHESTLHESTLHESTLHELTGIDGAPVRCVVAGRLCGLTSAVSVPAFQGAQQATDVSETGWLAGAVRAHERVILQALSCTSVLPMRFGTVYPQPQDVHAMLRRHQASLLAELHRLAGSTEWCLTVHADGAAVAPEPADADADAGASGTAWLLSRQAALRERTSRTDRLTELIDRLGTALAPHIRELVVSQPGAPGSRRMWLLVDEVARLQAAVAELQANQPGQLRLELTGPWPAYHFVRALQDDDAQDDDAQDDNALPAAGVPR